MKLSHKQQGGPHNSTFRPIYNDPNVDDANKQQGQGRLQEETHRKSNPVAVLSLLMCWNHSNHKNQLPSSPGSTTAAGSDRTDDITSSEPALSSEGSPNSRGSTRSMNQPAQKGKKKLPWFQGMVSSSHQENHHRNGAGNKKKGNTPNVYTLHDDVHFSVATTSPLRHPRHTSSAVPLAHFLNDGTTKSLMQDDASVSIVYLEDSQSYDCSDQRQEFSTLNAAGDNGSVCIATNLTISFDEEYAQLVLNDSNNSKYKTILPSLASSNSQDSKSMFGSDDANDSLPRAPTTIDKPKIQIITSKHKKLSGPRVAAAGIHHPKMSPVPPARNGLIPLAPPSVKRVSRVSHLDATTSSSSSSSMFDDIWGSKAGSYDDADAGMAAAPIITVNVLSSSTWPDSPSLNWSFSHDDGDATAMDGAAFSVISSDTGDDGLLGPIIFMTGSSSTKTHSPPLLKKSRPLQAKGGTSRSFSTSTSLASRWEKGTTSIGNQNKAETGRGEGATSPSDGYFFVDDHPSDESPLPSRPTTPTRYLLTHTMFEC